MLIVLSPIADIIKLLQIVHRLLFTEFIISNFIKISDFGTTLMTDKGEVQSTEENDGKRRWSGRRRAIGFEDLARKTGKY